MGRGQVTKKYNICVVGAGHVGLVAAACFAQLGHKVVCVDNDTKRIERLKKNILPFFEPQLKDLVRKNFRKGNLTFSHSLKNSVIKSEVIFIAVGTPPLPNGSADLTSIENVAYTIARNMNGYKLIVEKSTVPVHTGRKIKETIIRYKKNSNNFDVASNPEFLREGKAVYDFFYPDRIVIGVESLRAEKILKSIYASLKAPLVVTNINTAELIKHASNSFLAAKISFINAVSRVCDLAGADVEKVALAMGMDKRIGKHFLNAGIGYGGFCFHPEEILFVNKGAGLECKTFKELFKELDDINDKTINPVGELCSSVLSEKSFLTRPHLSDNGSRGKLVANSFGVKILSADRNFTFALKELLCITRRKYNDDLVVLKMSMGRVIKVTKDHPIVVLNGDKLDIKLAEEIKEKDKVVLPMGEFGENRAATIDVLSEIEGTQLLEKTWLNNKNMTGDNFEYLKPYLSNKYVYDVKKTGTMKAVDVLPARNILDTYDSNRLFTSRSRSSTVPYKIEIDKSFSRLIGYYLAEGWVSVDEGRGGIKRKRVNFSFGAHEKEYISDVKDIIDNLGVKYIEKVQNGAHAIIISSKLLAYVIEETLKCGSNCYNKKIPPQIFNSKEDIKWEFLKGILRGDGGIVRLNNGRNLNIEYATVSRNLAHSLLLLLQSLGIIVSMKRCYNNKSTVLTYIIKINGLEQVKKIGRLFGERWKSYEEVANNYKRNILPLGYKKFNNYALIEVKNTTREGYNGYVYSVETENSLFVSSGGILIHNCFPKDLEAFIHISNKLGYDFGLLKEVRKVNEKQKEYFVEKIKENMWVLKGKKIAVLGLSFKPDTDDMRFAPSVDIVNMLIDEGAVLSLYDPQAQKEAKEIFSSRNKTPKTGRLKFFKDVYSALKGCDCVCFLTEWEEFKKLDFKKVKRLMRLPLVVDGRNMLDRKEIKKLGFTYIGIGTP